MTSQPAGEKGLMQSLSDEGVVLIGDVAFETKRDMEKVRGRSTGWDDKEHYIDREKLSLSDV
jgi:hypothetical protein